MKRTSEEWQILKPNIIVFDPDGWDRRNYQFSWCEELITEEEYEQRLSRSTCIINENSNHWTRDISKKEKD